MVEKVYAWAEGAILQEHSRQKHKILREYFARYLSVRCQLPQQTRFRIAIVDGFAGAGRYNCGTAGSPIIFLEELKQAVQITNLERKEQGFAPIEFECLLIFNDAQSEAIELLKDNVAPILAEIKSSEPKLHLDVHYWNKSFEDAFPEIIQMINRSQHRNVLFNLDQCGHSHVNRQTLLNILHTYPSAEIFYTFAIESLIAFLRKSEPATLTSQLKYLGITTNDLSDLTPVMSKNAWLGVAERIVFEAFRACAPFVSPFSINNPDGWRYWLIHFANFYRGRQVYNNVLHANSSAQAHFGRSGLHMLSYDPDHGKNALYLFDDMGRKKALEELSEDIPRLISESGDAILVSEFYESIYNATPAHTDDIHNAIIVNPDITVLTPEGGQRRKANTIGINDTLKLNPQTSFFPMFQNIRKKP